MAELIVALDTADLDSALELVDRLQDQVLWYKVGLELFSACGPRAVEALRKRNRNVFLDLKYLDIPNTVQSATRVAAGLGVAMLTVHLCGGRRMIQAALDGCREGAGSPQTGPLILGVTMLTSTNQEDIAWMGNAREPGELAVELAAQGKSWGVDGVICSVLEVSRIKKACGSSCLCVTPGIRDYAPANALSVRDDQSRIATAARAVAAGSDYLVVGRPITKAGDPVRSAEVILRSMALQR